MVCDTGRPSPVFLIPAGAGRAAAVTDCPAGPVPSPDRPVVPEPAAESAPVARFFCLLAVFFFW